MRIDYLKIKNLKIVKNAELEFTKGINLITGENRIGKTTMFIGINTAFSGKLKKHLINRDNDAKMCYIECGFRHKKKKYKIVRQFFKTQSAKAKLYIDNELFSNSTAEINTFMQEHFKFFFSLGFLYYSKIGKLLIEYNIKKNDFLIEFFELQDLIKLSTAINKAIRVNKDEVPDWFYSYKDRTKLIVKYEKKIDAIRLKTKNISDKLIDLNDHIGDIKKFKDKKIIKESDYKKLQKEHSTLLAQISRLEARQEAKDETIKAMKKIISNDNVCPTCLRPFSGKESKEVKAAIERELSSLNSKIDKLEKQEDALARIIRYSTITDKDIPFKKLNKFIEQAQECEQVLDKLQDKLFELKHKIENWKTEQYNYEKVKEKIKTRQVNKLAKTGQNLTELIATLAEKIKEDLLHKMNEFLSVIYNGSIFISLKDGQFYLLQNDHEVLFDDLSASGSELEIVTFIFILSLSIVCGNKVVLLDEIFNTTSKATFDQVNRLINYSKKYFKQTIIISHKDTFEADNTIYL